MYPDKYFNAHALILVKSLAESNVTYMLFFVSFQRFKDEFTRVRKATSAGSARIGNNFVLVTFRVVILGHDRIATFFW